LTGANTTPGHVVVHGSSIRTVDGIADAEAEDVLEDMPIKEQAA